LRETGATAPATDQARLVEAEPGAESRIKWILVVSALMVLIVAVVGLVRPGPIDRWLGVETRALPTVASTPEPSPTPVLAAADGGGEAPSAGGVQAVLDPLVGSAALGSKVHVAVLDVASDEVLYSRNADVMTTPASTTKLLTAAVALAKLGPAYRLTTRAIAGAQPGEVVLVGGGDSTLSVDAGGQFPGAARLDQLASQVKKALGGTAPTRVLVDTSLFTGPDTAIGWGSDDISPGGQVSRIQSLMTNSGRLRPVHHEIGGDPRYSDPAIAAGKAFAKLLGVPTSTVKRGRAPEKSASASAAAGAAGQELGRVQSPPLVQVTDWMLEQSDNTIAEALGRLVALASGQPASFEGASEAMVAELRTLGLPGDEADLYDASGLSRHNGISPTLLTQLLALAAGGQQPALSAIFGGLPVAGWSGTMANRFVSPQPNQVGQGVVRAKTGTLSGVNTMAGELITKDGRLLVFAIMASGSANAVTGRAALDRVAAALVGCGC
jgi:D-alanyl-D-alanine carboxypeptidase/D-alanyl-D-alanine-endopeptidase (penicillin-binding protein 4)